jgi:hypothetical protein
VTDADRLCERVHEACRLSMDEARHRRRKRDAIREAAAHPRAAAECVDPIVRTLVGSLQSDRALTMVEAFGAVGTAEVRDAAMTALEEIADVTPAAVGRADVIRPLADCSDRASPEVQRRVFTLLGRCGGCADGVTVERHLVGTLAQYVTSSGWTTDAGPSALEAAGGLLAAGAPHRDGFVDVLETAFETGIESAQAAAAEAAGRGLTADPPRSDRLGELLRSAAAAPSGRVTRGAAVGACRALSGGADARSVADSILTDLLSSGDRTVREAVPDAVGDAVAEASAGGAERQADLLVRALDDAAAGVRVAAVKAARNAVETREDTIDPFVAVLETALIDRAEESNRRAVEALEHPEVARAFAEATDENFDRVMRSIERRLVSDPRREPSQAALSQVETVEGRFAPDDEQGRDDVDDSGETSDSAAIAESAARLSRQVRPATLADRAEAAADRRELATVVEAVERQFQQHPLDAQSAVTLWGVLLEAWGSAPAEVRRRIVDATATGVVWGHVAWDVAVDLFETARESDDPTVRERVVLAGRRLLERETVEWETIDPWIAAALEDESIDVRRAGVEAIGLALGTGAVRWDVVVSPLNDRLHDDDHVAEAVVQAVVTGLRQGTVPWTAVADVLRTARDGESRSVAERAVEAVGVGLQEEVVTWTDVGEFLQTARTAESTPIAERAVAAVHDGFLARAVTWGEVADFLWAARGAGSGVVAETAVESVRAGLLSGELEWDQVDEFLRAARATETDAVAREAVRAVGGGLQEGTVAWEEVERFLHRARRDGPTTVSTAAVRAVGAGLRGGTVTWTEAAAFLEDARDCGSEAAAEAAVTAVRDCLFEGIVGWSAVVAFLRTARETETDGVAREAVRAVGVGLQEGTVSWAEVSGFLRAAHVAPSDSLAEEAVRAAGAGLRAEVAGWDDVEGLLEAARDSGSEAVAETAVTAVRDCVFAGSVEWSAVSGYLRVAHEAGTDRVSEMAVRAVGAGLQEGTVAWPEAADFLRTARDGQTAAAAEAAVWAVGAGIQEGTVAWSEAADFLRTARDAESDGVSEMALRAVGAGIQRGTLAWAEVRQFLRAARETGADPVAELAVRIVRSGLDEATVTWDEAKAFLRAARTDGSRPVANAAVEAVGIGLLAGTVPWTEAAGHLEAVLDTGPDSIRETAVIAVHDGLFEGAVTWTDVRGFLETARTSGPEAVALAATRAVGAGLQEGTVAWTEAVEFLRGARDGGSNAVAEEAVRAVRAGLQGETVEWTTVGDFLRSAQRVDSRGVTEEILRAVWAGDRFSSLDFRQAGRILSEAFVDSPGVSERVARLAGDLITRERSLPPVVRSVLTTVSRDGSPLARLSVLRGVHLWAAEGGDVAEVIAVVANSLDDSEVGLRALGLRILETATTEGAGLPDETWLASRLDEALDDASADVRSRAVTVVATALTHGATNRDRFRALLLDVVTDEAQPEATRHAAVEALVDVRRSLVVDEAYVDALLVAGDGAPAVQRAVVDGAGTLLGDDRLDDGARRRLERRLWDGLEESTVRTTAARELADAQDRGDLTGEVLAPRELRRTLAATQFTATRRVTLVELVTETDLSVVLGPATDG